MKTKPKFPVLASATILLGTLASAFADNYNGASCDYARVISAQPKLRFDCDVVSLFQKDSL